MACPIYGDIGEGYIDEDGTCIIEIDDIFDESCEMDIEYQVFLQKENPGELWVEKK